ncbi:MAG: tRNA 2-thiouridine(34) synthase MnmA [Clostridiales bacterium]|nr:tRNA 2-thiouridine(34) synthase MnmA [Clostridiales bacterium]
MTTCHSRPGAKVVVALSGGVDSSFAALLLQRRGYAVEGLCLDLFEGTKAPEEAKAAGERLGIRVKVLDRRQAFREEVQEYFYQSYQAGLTPNPCAACNPAVKFRALSEAAEEAGAEWIATGHYARCVYDGDAGGYKLLRGADHRKDQSYFLYRLGQETLARVLFPLGDLTKEEVRAFAGPAGLPAATRRDSQEICFIPEGDYRSFIQNYKTSCPAPRGEGMPPGLRPGDFVDIQGKVLGRHKGLACYTVGQRKNLGASFGDRMYVLALRLEENQVVVGHEDALYRREIGTGSNCYVGGEAPQEPVRVKAKLRSGAAPAPAMYYPLADGEGRLVFDAGQRAAAPGQCAVYYLGDQVLGGGILLGE